MHWAQQCTVQRHASSRKALQMEARAATVRAAQRSTCLAMLRTRAVKAATCRRDAEEDGALGQRKELDASTRVTRACTEVAALPTSQMKALRGYDVLCAAGEEIFVPRK
jgi:hypothetical protein